jgi:hypothetical protein
MPCRVPESLNKVLMISRLPDQEARSHFLVADDQLANKAEAWADVPGHGKHEMAFDVGYLWFPLFAMRAKINVLSALAKTIGGIIPPGSKLRSPCDASATERLTYEDTLSVKAAADEIRRRDADECARR